MPVHDWTRVEAGIFHDFHHAWIEEIKRALNRGLLPSDYYALAEQVAGGRGPDVLTLQGPSNGATELPRPAKGIALATAEPKVRFHLRAEPDIYAAKAKAVTIRHISNHRVIAIVEVVSPGNKNSDNGLRAFVDKALELLRAGIHLMILDLFPPSERDPQGIHKAIWDELIDNSFALPTDKQLSLASYIASEWPEAFIEPVAAGDELPQMPLFLASDIYIQTPLEATYQSAWEAVPTYWRDVVTGRIVHRPRLD
jgi:hypothetical protein